MAMPILQFLTILENDMSTMFLSLVKYVTMIHLMTTTQQATMKTAFFCN